MDGIYNNARSTVHADRQPLPRDRPLGDGEEPPLASHLVTRRAFYSHHGIYVGNDRVIHYSGLARGLQLGPVEDISLENFAHGRGIRVRHDSPRFDRREVVERARSRLGEHHYRLLTNNCEHFCAWALRGESRSSQVERLRTPSRALRDGICALRMWLKQRRRTSTLALSRG